MGKKYINNIKSTYLLKCCFIVFYFISCVNIIFNRFLVEYLELFNPRIVTLLNSIIVPDLTFQFRHRPVVRVYLRGDRLRNQGYVSVEIIFLSLLVTSCERTTKYWFCLRQRRDRKDSNGIQNWLRHSEIGVVPQVGNGVRCDEWIDALVAIAIEMYLVQPRFFLDEIVENQELVDTESETWE